MSYNVFITHGWQDDEEYSEVVSWIKNSEIADQINITSMTDKASLDAADGHTLRLALSDQIEAADCVIILGSMYAKYAGWLDHEFVTSKNLDKRIILIKPLARAFAKNAIVPFPVQGAAHVVLTWHEPSLINALSQGLV